MPFGSLWLPVVVSAVVVWLLSAVLHMALKYHKADYKRLPGEEAVAAAMREDSPPPGFYAMPYVLDPAELKDPAVAERYERGPVAFVTVLPNGPPSMGKSLGLWFAFCLLVSFTAAYVVRHCFLPGADAIAVLRISGTVAFVGYGYGAFQDSIWKAIPWSNSLRALLDAAIYSLVTAFVFLWLWPA